MTFVQRKLRATFVLAQGTFAESGGDTLTIEGLRMSARVKKAGSPGMGTCDAQIWGMTKSQMNQLSTLGMVVQEVPRNVVTLEAGDDESGMSIVFVGNVLNGWFDPAGAPNVAFSVNAAAGGAFAVIQATPSSYTGPTDVAAIMASLAEKMSLTFENNGVSAMLASPYYFGSARDQAAQAAQDAGISWVIDNGALAIWPQGGSRGGEVPLISPATGMVGYPTFVAQGIQVRTLFNRNISFGGQVRVQSDLDPANGTWRVLGLGLALDAQVPGGQWFTDVSAYGIVAARQVLPP